MSVLVLLLGLVGLSACTSTPRTLLDVISGISLTEVCTPVAVADGSGGVYVAYEKNLQGVARIAYLQRLDADGKPLWPGNGPRIYLENVPGYEHFGVPVGKLVAAKDGAILVWYLGSGVWAQKVDSGGDLLWGRQGVKSNVDLPPSGAPGAGLLGAVSDGAGGVVIAAYAGPPAGITLDRLDASGKSVWSGKEWSAGPSSPPAPPYELDVSAGASGDFFVWWNRGTSWGIQKVNAQGEFQWGPEGVVPPPAMSGSSCEQAVDDGMGGVLVLCNAPAERLGSSGQKQGKLFAQHFDTQGKPLWPESGVVLAKLADEGSGRALVPDGAGGAVVAWQSPDNEIYAQRVSPAGQLWWGEQGLRVVPKASFFSPAPGDKPGEALIGWKEPVSAEGGGRKFELRAQKLTEDGAVAWGTGGTAFTVLEPVGASTPLIIADGEGGAWLIWTVGHFGADHNDITYIQRVGANGRPLWGERGVKLSALR